MDREPEPGRARYRNRVGLSGRASYCFAFCLPPPPFLPAPCLPCLEPFDFLPFLAPLPLHGVWILAWRCDRRLLWPVSLMTPFTGFAQRLVEFCSRPCLPPGRTRTNLLTGRSGMPVKVVRMPPLKLSILPS